MDLHSSLEEYRMKILTGNIRSKINRSLKKGFNIKSGGFDLIEDFWSVINQTMRELGSPYHSKKYIEHILHKFGSDAE